MRSTNLLAIVAAAAPIAISGELVRSRRQSDRPEMSALRGSNAGNRQTRVQMYCVNSAAPTIATACAPPISKSSRSKPYASSPASSVIW